VTLATDRETKQDIAEVLTMVRVHPMP